MKISPLFAIGIAALLSSISSFGQTSDTTSGSTTTNPTGVGTPGVLGATYTDLNLTLERIEHSSGNGYNAGILGNVPMAPYADLRLAYDYWWYNSGGNRSHYHLVTAESRFYVATGGVKPYVGALVGYQWAQDNYNGYGPPPPSTTTAPSSTGTSPSTTSTSPSSSTGSTSGYTTTTTPVPGGYTTTTTTSAYTYTRTTTHQNNAVWGITAGVEFTADEIAFTPHFEYFHPTEADSRSIYQYGLEANHWFTETIGGYADVTYYDSRREPKSWWYTAGVRLKF